MVAWLLAAAHLLGLGVGLGAVWTRARALRATPGPAAFRRALSADAAWGIAALIWIATGLLRAFAGYEKGTAYYLQSNAFVAKMALFALIFALEVWPMVTLVRARAARATTIDPRLARTFARISELQAALLVAMVFLASAMARGVWH